MAIDLRTLMSDEDTQRVVAGVQRIIDTMGLSPWAERCAIWGSGVALIQVARGQRWRAWLMPVDQGWMVFAPAALGQVRTVGEFGQKGAAIDSVRAEIAASIARERAARW